MRNRLSELRKNQSLSQTELAKLLNVSQQLYSSWETSRTLPKPFQMQQLEDLFGVRKEEIFFKEFNYKM